MTVVMLIYAWEIDRPSIFTLVHIKEELEKLFKCPVDVVRLRNNMDELLRNCINKDGIDMCRKQIKNDLPQLKEILEQIIDEFDKCD